MLTWSDLVQELLDVERIAARFYFEADNTLASISLAWDSGNKIEARYLPFHHRFGDNLHPLEHELREFFAGLPFVVWRAAGVRDSLNKALGMGLNVAGDVTTAALMMGILYDRDLHGLGTHLIGGSASGLEQKLAEGDVKIQDFNAADPDLVDMAVRDARLVLDLEKELRRQLENVGNLEHYDKELVLNRLVWDIELKGIPVKWSDLWTLKVANERLVEELRSEVFSFFPKPINLNSTKQLASMLFDEPKEGGLGIEPVVLTGRGHRSTSREALEAIERSHPVVPKLLAYKDELHIQKAYDGLEKARRGDRIYPCWSAFSSGGSSAISCARPALKSLPLPALRTLDAGLGQKWMGIEFPAAGLHFLAAVSGEEKLAAVLNNPEKDVYEEFAKAWGVERAQAKQLLYVIPSRYPNAHESTTVQRILRASSEVEVLPVLSRFSASLPKLVAYLNKQVTSKNSFIYSFGGRYRHISQKDNAGQIVACFTHQDPGVVLKEALLRIEDKKEEDGGKTWVSDLDTFLPLGNRLLFLASRNTTVHSVGKLLGDLLTFDLGNGYTLPHRIVEGQTVADCLSS